MNAPTRQAYASASRTAPVAAAFATQQSRYGYCAGGLRILVPKGMPSEVLVRPVVHPLPRCPRWMRGVLNLRGSIVPLFHFGFVADAIDSSNVGLALVLGERERAMAIALDALPASVTPARSNTVPALPAMLMEHVQGVFEANGEFWLDLDHHALFSSFAHDPRRARLREVDAATSQGPPVSVAPS
jgi:chemotaxis signal transduction protein